MHVVAIVHGAQQARAGSSVVLWCQWQVCKLPAQWMVEMGRAAGIGPAVLHTEEVGGSAGVGPTAAAQCLSWWVLVLWHTACVCICKQ
jgi:hypothetical protein